MIGTSKRRPPDFQVRYAISIWNAYPLPADLTRSIRSITRGDNSEIPW